MTVSDRITAAQREAPYDAGDEADRARDPEAARALYSLMTSISEACWSASWMKGLEDALWHMLEGASRRYGMGEERSEQTVSEVSVAALRYLHERCDGWWCWQQHDTPRFVTTQQWRLMRR